MFPHQGSDWVIINSMSLDNIVNVPEIVIKSNKNKYMHLNTHTHTHTATHRGV